MQRMNKEKRVRDVAIGVGGGVGGLAGGVGLAVAKGAALGGTLGSVPGAIIGGVVGGALGVAGGVGIGYGVSVGIVEIANNLNNDRMAENQALIRQNQQIKQEKQQVESKNKNLNEEVTQLKNDNQKFKEKVTQLESKNQELESKNQELGDSLKLLWSKFEEFNNKFHHTTNTNAEPNQASSSNQASSNAVLVEEFGQFKRRSTSARIQEHLICKITLDLMDDPITVSTGQTYERKALETWRQLKLQEDGRYPDPATRSLIADDPSVLTTNYVIKSAVDELKNKASRKQFR